MYDLGSHSSGYEKVCLLGHNAMQFSKSQHFGGTCNVHVPYQIVSQARNQYGGLLAACFMLASWFGLLFNLEDEGNMFF
jgi:hypothetical protein